MPTHSKTRTSNHPVAGFDVTCVVGRVALDADGDTHPHVAAFQLIAEHDAPGEYRFPMARGGTCVVNVDHETVPE